MQELRQALYPAPQMTGAAQAPEVQVWKPPATGQSALVQQDPDGMHALPQLLYPAAQLIGQYGLVPSQFDAL